MDEPLAIVMLPGAPRGKGRPRARIVKPKFKPMFIHFYNDVETVHFEDDLRDAGIEAMAGRAPFDFALTVFIEAFVPIPESWSARKKAAAAAGEIHATSKPDGDNYQKIAGDALNKVVWVDDSLIVMWQCLKKYDHFPRLRVSVWAWDDLGEKEPSLI